MGIRQFAQASRFGTCVRADSFRQRPSWGGTNDSNCRGSRSAGRLRRSRTAPSRAGPRGTVELLLSYAYPRSACTVVDESWCASRSGWIVAMMPRDAIRASYEPRPKPLRKSSTLCWVVITSTPQPALLRKLSPVTGSTSTFGSRRSLGDIHVLALPLPALRGCVHRTLGLWPQIVAELNVSHECRPNVRPWPSAVMVSPYLCWGPP